MSLTVGLLVAVALIGVIAVILLLQLRARVEPVDLTAIVSRTDSLERAIERHERSIRGDLSTTRDQALSDSRSLREELALSQTGFADSVRAQIAELVRVQQQQLDGVAARIAALADGNERRLEGVREVVDTRLRAMQEDNAARLEQMRATVDEKLQTTLNNRLDSSFRIVSERLEQVQKGLGEMQELAVGVGDIKKVLANVKTRGVWGEVQLEALLDQILIPDQYARNVATVPRSRETVEFAVRLPGRGASPDAVVWLPIDSKFPVEDYLRLEQAREIGDVGAMEASSKALEARVKACAKDICAKYVLAPHTTDFGIMFLPTEALYAEVLRRPGVVESLLRDHKVAVTGPSTLAALLNCLRVGFSTLAIEQRAGEVWAVLASVKAEFGKFGTALDGIQKRLDQASAEVEKVAKSSKKIEQKLKDVQSVDTLAESTMDRGGIAIPIGIGGVPTVATLPIPEDGVVN